MGGMFTGELDARFRNDLMPRKFRMFAMFRSSPARWELHKELEWVDKSGLTVTAERGFVTDFASSPRFLWWVFSPATYPRPAVIHDKLWHMNRRGYGPDPTVSDRIFRDALEADGCPFVERWLGWWAVRLAAVVSGRAGRGGAAGWWLLLLAPLLVVSSFLGFIVYFLPGLG